MKAIVQIVGADILCRGLGPQTLEYRIDGTNAQEKLHGWAARYSRATRLGDEAELLAIGSEKFDWLNSGGWAAAWAKAAGPRELEIWVDDPAKALARAILESPWELLARDSAYLADDDVQLFELYRRVGAVDSPAAPQFGDLQLMFMAAAPAGENPLSFEAEETGILEATKRLPLHLVVEESGNAQYLRERLDLDGPFEALHLSCHGDIHPQHGPQLALEDETGQLALVHVGQLVDALGDPKRMPLIFLSACRTAEQSEAGKRTAEPFVRELVRAGVANVLGWDGSVYDADALTYARSFYSELASLQQVPRAAAVARHALRRCQIDNPRQGRHWHLARLYLGPAGGGALAAKGRPKRKPAGGGDQFLDPARQEVLVAGPAEFVGRRRATQAVLNAFRDGVAGVLIHGMGNLGKSSLAFRVSSRLTRHTKVVVFGKYDALSVLDCVIAALLPQERKPAIDVWRNAVLDDPTQLADALEALLEGPLDARPILLVVDDLERILETPSQSDGVTPVQAGYRAVLIAILRAFRQAQCESRLLITSRYRFCLPDSGGADLASDLVCVPLQPMDDNEREKQLRAAARIADVDDLAGVDTVLLQRALDVAQGNPGLQAVLSRPILKRETAVAKDALAAIEHFQTTGAPPERIRALIAQGIAADEANAMVAFFKRMAFDTYRTALTPEQADMLQACCLFSAGLPIPRPAVEAAGRAAGVEKVADALNRLLWLGLVDDWGDDIDTGMAKSVAHVAANPLARPLIGGAPKDITAAVASTVLSELNRCWRDSNGSFVPGRQAVEIARLALIAGCSCESNGIILKNAAVAAGKFLIRDGQASKAHSQVLGPAYEQLGTLAASLDSLIPGAAAFQMVSSEEAIARAISSPYHKLLSAELTSLYCESLILSTKENVPDPIVRALEPLAIGNEHHGWNALYQALKLRLAGRYPEAKLAYIEASEFFFRLGQTREWAICRKGFCSVLVACEEFREAQHLLRHEVLPAFNETDDPWLLARTLGAISMTCELLGDLTEALKISRENELPLYERMDDLIAQTVTLDRIAKMHDSLGEINEASSVRSRLSSLNQQVVNAHERAASLEFIAEEFRTEREVDRRSRLGLPKLNRGMPTFHLMPEKRIDELCLLVKLGALRDRATAIGEIADHVQHAGDLDEASRIRREIELEVLRALNDNCLLAAVLSKVSQICYSRSQLDEAIKLLNQSLEIELPAGDCKGLAQIQYLRASFQLVRGGTNLICIEKSCDVFAEALRALRELERPRGTLVVSMQLGQALSLCKKQDSAIQVFNSAMESLEKFGNPEDVRWAYLDFWPFMNVFMGSTSRGHDLAARE